MSTDRDLYPLFLAPVAVALITVLGFPFPLRAQPSPVAPSEASQPKKVGLRIMGGRSSEASTVVESSGAVVERAGVSPPAQPPGGSAARSAPSTSSRPAVPAPSRPGAVPAGRQASSYTPPPPPSGQDLSSRRAAALLRLNEMNQAQTPKDAGVPQARGGAGLPRDRAAPRPVTSQTAVAQVAPIADHLRNGPGKSAYASAQSVATSVAPADPSLPYTEAPAVRTDVLASEVIRDGEDYLFNGSINGLPVRFRILESVSGIRIPSRVAMAANAIPANVNLRQVLNEEVMAPISAITFGSFPVRGVIVTIFQDDRAEMIEVGLDALTNFKIKDLNGRRVLTRS